MYRNKNKKKADQNEFEFERGYQLFHILKNLSHEN